MKTIEELLRNLARPEVVEFGLVTNRLPSVNIGGKFEPVDDEALGNERLLQMLVAMGGSRHVDTLSESPVQWTTRLDGVGAIHVAAIRRKDIIQARFTVMKRESVPGTPPTPTRPPSEKAVPVGKPALPPAESPKAASVSRLSAAPAKPSVPPRTPTKPPPLPDDLPLLDDDNDDNEPTLQTQSPPSKATSSDDARRKRHEAKSEGKAGEGEETSAIAPTASDAKKESAAAAAHEEAAREQLVRELAAQEQRVVQERVARERAAAEAQRSRPTVASPTGMRRIATPTSVDKAKPGVGAVSRPPLREPRSVPAFGGSATTTDKSLVAQAPTDLDLAKHAAAAVAQREARTSVEPPAEKDWPRVETSAAIDSFLAMAVAGRASELFIVSGRPIMLRVATDLLPRTQPIPAEQVERIVNEVVPARLRSERLDRDGACDFALDHPVHGRFRANVSKQRTGFMLSLRVISRPLPTPATLGLPDAVTDALRHASGLVLVTGPAGHGKSTTLAALVDHLNRETARHIMTIEDPIEHVHVRKKSLVSQREIGVHGASVKRLVECALRDDVDTVVIGEIRDAESAREALVACDAGRLVLATMNALTAAKAIDRVLSAFAPNEEMWSRATLASSLRLVIGQRLVPSADRTRRHAALELLPWSVSLHGLLRDGRTSGISELQKRGRAVGVHRLDESLAELVRGQKITIDVAKQLAELPGDLDAPGRTAPMPAQARKG